jgi:broad specificity phosphatase PhoE
VAPEALADLYVRHAMPLVDPDLPSDVWDLGPAGRAAARELATGLVIERPMAMVASSTERKAVATAEPIAERFGVPLAPDARLVEAGRPWVGAPNDYRQLAHRFLRGDQPDGWEDRAEVVDRMAEAVRDARKAAAGGAVAVVGHGLSLCVHLESVLPAGFDAEDLWARLSFPDAWEVDLTRLVLSRARH